MLGAVAHIGITVRDMENAVQFYRDLLGLRVIGDITIEGAEADEITQEKGVKLRAVYLRSADDLKGPPIELLHFVQPTDADGVPYPRLTNPGITEVAFWVKDIEAAYRDLRAARGKVLFSASALRA
jgi:glyoxylase I family protein